jgi:phage shock protein A
MDENRHKCARDSDRLIRDLLKENKELKAEVRASLSAKDSDHVMVLELTNENEELREVIYQMRQDMEAAQQQNNEADFVPSLEREIEELSIDNESLFQQLKEARNEIYIINGEKRKLISMSNALRAETRFLLGKENTSEGTQSNTI